MDLDEKDHSRSFGTCPEAIKLSPVIKELEKQFRVSRYQQCSIRKC